MRKFPALTALTLGLALAVTACGSNDSDDTAAAVSTTEHNDADVAFATEMIPHHAGALVMVDMTSDRDLDPEVQTLAEDIRDAQAPEIETMSGWLTDWDEPIPATMRDHGNSEEHGGHDMGDDMGTGMPGMMTGEDMNALEQVSDAEFQDMWLEMMVEHHKGAVQMAETEEAEGQYKPAVDLAKDIQKSQKAEIDTMQGLLS